MSLISGLWFPWPIYMFLKWDEIVYFRSNFKVFPSTKASASYDVLADIALLNLLSCLFPTQDTSSTVFMNSIKYKMLTCYSKVLFIVVFLYF